MQVTSASFLSLDEKDIASPGRISSSFAAVMTRLYLEGWRLEVLTVPVEHRVTDSRQLDSQERIICAMNASISSASSSHAVISSQSSDRLEWFVPFVTL